MLVASAFLARRLVYDVPRQDLRIDYARLPALPRSRSVIANVRLADVAERARAGDSASITATP